MDTKSIQSDAFLYNLSQNNIIQYKFFLRFSGNDVLRYGWCCSSVRNMFTVILLLSESE